MSDSSIKHFGQQAKHLVRQVSGAARAVSTAEHTASHLQNVERWAQQEFLQQRHAHEHRLNELESRVAKLEKVQHAITAAGQPEKTPSASDALNVVQITPSYFRHWTNLLAEVATTVPRLREPGAVLEIFCGAGKSAEFLSGRFLYYMGFEPSPVLRAAAARKLNEEHVSFIDDAQFRVLDYQADLILFLAEKQRWSIFDTEQLLTRAVAYLKPDGVVLLHLPLSLQELSLAGWSLEERVAKLGLVIRQNISISGPGAVLLLERESHV